MQKVIRPVSSPTGADVFEIASESGRAAYLKSLGARNADPPLPHSPCLRIKATGRVLPWNELLAEQRDLAECCDANGNTDPEAWAHLVVTGEEDEGDLRAEMLKAQEKALEMNADMAVYRVPHPADIARPEPRLPERTVFFDDLVALMGP